jgi:hypothetical protein
MHFWWTFFLMKDYNIKNLLLNNIPHCKSNKFISQDKKISTSRTFAHYHISLIMFRDCEWLISKWTMGKIYFTLSSWCCHLSFLTALVVSICKIYKYGAKKILITFEKCHYTVLNRGVACCNCALNCVLCSFWMCCKTCTCSTRHTWRKNRANSSSYKISYVHVTFLR